MRRSHRLADVERLARRRCGRCRRPARSGRSREVGRGAGRRAACARRASRRPAAPAPRRARAPSASPTVARSRTAAANSAQNTRAHVSASASARWRDLDVDAERRRPARPACAGAPAGASRRASATVHSTGGSGQASVRARERLARARGGRTRALWADEHPAVAAARRARAASPRRAGASSTIACVMPVKRWIPRDSGARDAHERLPAIVQLAAADEHRADLGDLAARRRAAPLVSVSTTRNSAVAQRVRRGRCIATCATADADGTQARVHAVPRRARLRAGRTGTGARRVTTIAAQQAAGLAEPGAGRGPSTGSAEDLQGRDYEAARRRAWDAAPATLPKRRRRRRAPDRAARRVALPAPRVARVRAGMRRRRRCRRARALRDRPSRLGRVAGLRRRRDYANDPRPPTPIVVSAAISATRSRSPRPSSAPARSALIVANQTGDRPASITLERRDRRQRAGIRAADRPDQPARHRHAEGRPRRGHVPRRASRATASTPPASTVGRPSARARRTTCCSRSASARRARARPGVVRAPRVAEPARITENSWPLISVKSRTVDTEPGELPATMAAWVIRQEREGEPVDAFQVEEIEVPEPGAFEVIVRVMAAGVNFNNVWAALGEPVSVFALRRPPGVRPPHRRLGRLGRRLEGRPRRHALEGRRRGRRPLQPGLLRGPRGPRPRPDGRAVAEDLGLRDDLGLLRPVHEGPGPAAAAQAARTSTWEEAASYGLTYFTAYRMLDRPRASCRPARRS